MDKNTENTPIHKPLWKNGYIIVAIIISLISLAFYLLNINNLWEFEYLKDSDNSFTAGLATVGDYFGGVLNPVLTFITIILLIRSIELQRADFRTQLKEQEEQKAEFKRQADAQEDQIKELKVQNENQEKAYKTQIEWQEKESKKNNFDKMFSLLMEQHNQLLQNSSFKREVDNIYSEFIPAINDIVTFPSNINNIENIIYKYNEINTYTRFLYRFLKYLSDTEESKELNDIDVIHYARLLRSFISNKLLYILMMNGVRDESIGNFGDYRLFLNKFNFLEHTVLTVISEFLLKSITSEGIAFSTLIKSYEKNETLLLSKFKLADLEALTGFNLYLKYSPEAFGKNPYYKEKIRPMIDFFIEKNVIEKEFWKNN